MTAGMTFFHISVNICVHEKRRILLRDTILATNEIRGPSVMPLQAMTDP
jgi:hypothetical protein